MKKPLLALSALLLLGTAGVAAAVPKVAESPESAAALGNGAPAAMPAAPAGNVPLAGGNAQAAARPAAAAGKSAVKPRPASNVASKPRPSPAPAPHKVGAAKLQKSAAPAQVATSPATRVQPAGRKGVHAKRRHKPAAAAR